MLGALVLCSPSEHVFCCTLLTLHCACVNEPQALHESSEEPCSAAPRWPHRAYGRGFILTCQRTPLVAQMVKCLPTMQETWVQSLGQEDLLERKSQPTPVFLPGKSHGWRDLVDYSPWGPLHRVGHDWETSLSLTSPKLLGSSLLISVPMSKERIRKC